MIAIPDISVKKRGTRLAENKALRNIFHVLQKAPRSRCLLHLEEQLDLGLFAVSALGADAFFVQSDAAERATVDFVVGFKLGRRRIDAAGERDFGNVQFILEEIVDDFDHAFYRQRLFGDNQTALGIRGREFGAERRPFHYVLRRAVADPRLFVNVENGGQQRVVFAQNQCVVKVFKDCPGGFLNFVTGEYHVDAGLDAVFDFERQNTGMAVEILRFSFEPVESVGILQVKRCDTSHS